MTSFIRATMAGLLALIGVVRTPLAAQTNLTAAATAPTTVTLTWTAAPNATRYWVQRAIGSATLANLPAPKITGTSYTDAKAPAGTTISYRVMAGSPSGPHTYSGTINVTTPATGSTTASAPTTTPAPASLAPATAPAPVAVTLAPVSIAPVSIAPVSLQPGMPTVAPTVSKTAVVGAVQPLREAPSGVRLPAGAAPVAAAPAPVWTGTPVNPSGFIAKQTGDGQVQLSWNPVDGASYYVLLGPGVPEASSRVSGATTFTATGVPPGLQEWAVASYYEPGPVSTVAAEFRRTRATLEPMLLTGWVDLHTHPMINLAFGGKLVHGGVDVGSLLPQDLTCNGPTRAVSMDHALGEDRPSHGGKNWLNFTCGDDLRKLLIWSRTTLGEVPRTSSTGPSGTTSPTRRCGTSGSDARAMGDSG